MGQMVVKQQAVVQCPIMFVITFEKVQCRLSSLILRFAEIVDFHWGQLLKPI